MDRMRDAAVVTVGTELTEGLRSDTNARYVARALAGAGFTVREIMSLPDDEEEVAGELSRLLVSCVLVVVTGGLGPTHDDITRAAAARAAGKRLRRDPGLEESFRRVATGRIDERMMDRFLSQADVVEGARSLHSVFGTVPGMVIDCGVSTLVLLPGPPREMRPMLDSYLGEVRTGIPPITLRCFGILEADTQSRVQPVLAGFAGIDLTLLADERDVEVILLARDADEGTLRAAAEACRVALGDDCFSADGTPLPAVVLEEARSRGYGIAVAESCTGGLVASALTDVPGASDAFVGGVVAYTNGVKAALLGVDEDMLASVGPVSSPVAVEMARGALRLPGATLAVSITGVAGPAGGTEETPVGLLWFGIASADGHQASVRRRYFGGREAIRGLAAATALDLLRRFMLEH